MDNAAWVKSSVTVSADAAPNPTPPGDGASTADQCSFTGANRRLEEVTSLAATSGTTAETEISPVPGEWTRFEVTNNFPGVGDVVCSVYVQHVSNVGTLVLGLRQFGGFVRAYLLSVDAAVAVNIWGWQLEAGTAATDYTPRTT